MDFLQEFHEQGRSRESSGEGIGGLRGDWGGGGWNRSGQGAGAQGQRSRGHRIRLHLWHRHQFSQQRSHPRRNLLPS